MFKCMNLLRKYSLGDKPCNLEIISDPVQVCPTFFKLLENSVSNKQHEGMAADYVEE